MKWLALFLLVLPLSAHAQSIPPLAEPPQHVRNQDQVARFNQILAHPQDSDATAWEWYTFTDDTGWRAGSYNWAVVKWNEGFHTTAIAHFKWLSNHCGEEPKVCKLSKINMRLKP